MALLTARLRTPPEPANAALDVGVGEDVEGILGEDAEGITAGLVDWLLPDGDGAGCRVSCASGHCDGGQQAKPYQHPPTDLDHIHPISS
jgi:hypothetical protein